MDQIPPPEMLKGITSDQIEAALQFGAPKVAWLKEYLQNTFAAITNGENISLLVNWLLTQWLVNQFSTSFSLPLSTILISSDI